MGKNNANLMEPKSLTRCGLWSLHKANLVEWAKSRCLLEHLSDEELEAGNKEFVVLEILGAVLRAEVAEDTKAIALGYQARPIRAIIDGTADPIPEP